MVLNKIGSGFSREAIILIIAVVTLILILLGTYVFNQKDVGTGQEYSPKDGPALLNNSIQLFNSLDNSDYYTSIAEDLSAFARFSLDRYSSGKYTDILFSVRGDVTRDNDSIYFEGVFEHHKDIIKVQAELLNYGKLNVSMSGKGLNDFNSQLPSNTLRNQYIGKLPDTSNPSFTIDFSEKSNKYLINLFDDSVSTHDKAIKKIQDSIGTSVDRSEYIITIPVSERDGIPLPPGTE